MHDMFWEMRQWRGRSTAVAVCSRLDEDFVYRSANKPARYRRDYSSVAAIMKAFYTCISVTLILLGMALSDFVALYGFPFDRYLIQLHHDGSPEASFRCNKLAAVLGENLSTFDTQSGAQSTCFILATGTKDEFGNFHGRLGWPTWTARAVHWSSTVEIPSESIKAISKN